MSGGSAEACDDCLCRAWLLAGLAGRLHRVRSRLDELLALGDGELVAAVGGHERATLQRSLDAFEPAAMRAAVERTDQTAVCRCSARFPLVRQGTGPRALFVRGGLERLSKIASGPAVAIVGARRATPYGTGVARSLAHGLAAAGLWVVSGMANGIDAAAHRGALEARGRTAAVLPADVGEPYPRGQRQLHREIAKAGLLVSELPPGTALWPWMFLARNRIIATLATVTVIVEASDRSGSLVTARHAVTARRIIGAVPGPVTSPLSDGPHALLTEGAALIRGPEDVLELLYPGDVPALIETSRDACLTGPQRALLAALAEGCGADSALQRAGLDPGEGLSALAWLELEGYVRRDLAGRCVVVRRYRRG